MTAATVPQQPVPSAPERPRRKRHWLRWTIVGTAVLVVLIMGLVAANQRVGLVALTTGDAKPAPQFGISLDTQRYPDATIGLTQPVTLDAAITSGTTLTVNAAGTLTLHGVTRTVTVALSVRRDGASIDAAGSVPVAFADYGIAGPKGYGGLGSLADHGVAEFLLVLPRI
jgi:YceI-like domain